MPLVRLVLMYPNGTKEPLSALDLLPHERPELGHSGHRTLRIKAVNLE
jgi:hypothetical protein